MTTRPRAECAVVWEADGMIFHAEFLCFITSLHYDYEDKVGTLVLGTEDSCTDMAGAISTFLQLDHKVQQIDVLLPSGDQDICYLLSETGKWLAIPHT